MKKLLLASIALALGLPAHAATLTLPSVTFTSPVSTVITCAQTAAANLVVPVAAGATIFSCTVAPTNWNGVVFSGGLVAPFQVSGLTGNTFSITLSAAVTAAATDAPGSISTTP